MHPAEFSLHPGWSRPPLEPPQPSAVAAVRLNALRVALLAVAALSASHGLAATPDRGAGVSNEVVTEFQKRNGRLFENWPTPRAVLAITGELDGYIEPCGCTGKENQKGGLSRRQNFLDALRKAG